MEMELIIQQYFSVYGTCCIPGLGTLALKRKSSAFSISDHSLSSPQWSLVWTDKVSDDSLFLEYLAGMLQLSVDEASRGLSSWVNKITNHHTEFTFTIPGIGKWKREAGKPIVFTEEKIINAWQTISAKKIVRAHAIHQVRVGDTEHTNVQMTELLQQHKKPVRLETIGWTALLFAILALATLAYYSFNDYRPGGLFGDEQKINAGTPPDTYQLIP